MRLPHMKARLLAFAASALLSMLFAGQGYADPVQEVDLASTTAWTLDGAVKPVPGGGWNAQGISRTKDNVVYQRSITLPNYTAGNVVKILFGAVNHGAEVYIDNKLVNTHIGPMTPFESDITTFVTPGGTHTLKVTAYSAAHYKNANGMYIVPRGYLSSNFSQGITKYIKLAVYPQVYIKDYFIRTSVANKQLTYDVWLHNAGTTSRSVKLDSKLTSWNNDPWTYPTIDTKDVTLPAGAVTKVTIGPVAWNLGPASYWWPNVPFRENYQTKLHYLGLSVKDGPTVVDTSRPRFGFVEWTEATYYYKVNGVRIESQASDGTNEDLMGWYDCYSTCPAFLPPTGPKTGCAETWRRYMRLGVNTNRIHQSTPTRYMMDVADEVGFMLIPETAIRGSINDQAWNHDYFTTAEREQALLCRNHPSVCRYSLENEMNVPEKMTNENERTLVDTCFAYDGTRPMISVEWAGNGTIGTVWTGHSGGRTVAALNYPGYQGWPRTKTFIQSVGEHSYSDWDQTPCGATDIVREGDRGLDMRRRDIVYQAIWTITLVWPNFLEGQNRSKIGSAFKSDRTDNVDGWGSEPVRWVQRALDPYIVLDSLLTNVNMCFSTNWPTTVPSFASGATITRDITIINGGFFGNRMGIYWEARRGSATGAIAASGAIDPIPVEPGFRATKSLSFPVPAATATADTVSVPVGAKIMYKEDRVYYNVNSEKLYIILKSVLYGGDSATPVTSRPNSRAVISRPDAYATVNGIMTLTPDQMHHTWADVYDVMGKRLRSVRISESGGCIDMRAKGSAKVFAIRTR